MQLQPGKYRLHLKAAELGNARSAPPTIRKEDIQIKAGEVARAEVVLKKFPFLTVVGVTVEVGAIAGALVWYSNWTRGLKSRVTLAPVTRTNRDPETSRPTRRRTG